MLPIRRTLAISAAAVPVLATLVLVSSGSAHASTPISWTYYPVGTTLSGSTTTTVVGTVGADGGCEYDLSNSGTGSVTTEEIETAESTSTCTAQFTTGVPTDFTGDTTSPSGSAADADATDSTTTVTTPTVTPGVVATTYGHSIYQDNKWLDPVGIQVNAQEQWFHWNSGGCVGAWAASWKWSWLSADGWAKRWGDSSVATGCGSDTVKSDSAFQNTPFCAGITTYTYFGWNGTGKVADTLTGTNTGGWAWSYHDYKNGSTCNNLLHHGHIFKA